MGIFNRYSDILGKEEKPVDKKEAKVDAVVKKPEQIVKIVDLKPETIDEVKVILQGATITAENFKKLEAVIVKDAE